MAMRMPGIKVAAPMAPKEWEEVWKEFEAGDDPILCSESRQSFKMDFEYGLEYLPMEYPTITIIAISTARLNALQAAKVLNNGMVCNLFGIVWLKPFYEHLLHAVVRSLRESKFGIVVDGDYETCGASQSLAYELSHLAHVPVHALGLEDRTAGFSKETDNVTPSAERIVEFVRSRL